MKIIIGSDHGGFDLKEACKSHLSVLPQWELTDAGIFSRDPEDYPKIAHKVAQGVAKDDYQRGIVANRYKGVRAGICHNLFTARLSRQHNDANILVMGGRVIGVGIALEMVDLFLTTPFDGGRHELRVNQID